MMILFISKQPRSGGAASAGAGDVFFLRTLSICAGVLGMCNRPDRSSHTLSSVIVTGTKTDFRSLDAGCGFVARFRTEQAAHPQGR